MIRNQVVMLQMSIHVLNKTLHFTPRTGPKMDVLILFAISTRIIVNIIYISF